MMIDLREHKEAIKRAVAVERVSDELYSWSVKSVGKTVAKIHWSYLSKGEDFVIEAKYGDDDLFIEYHDPHENFFGGYIVGGRFGDFESVDEALVACVKAIARNAHRLY